MTASQRRCLILSFDLMLVGSELEALITSRLQPLGFADDEMVMAGLDCAFLVRARLQRLQAIGLVADDHHRFLVVRPVRGFQDGLHAGARRQPQLHGQR